MNNVATYPIICCFLFICLLTVGFGQPSKFNRVSGGSGVRRVTIKFNATGHSSEIGKTTKLRNNAEPTEHQCGGSHQMDAKMKEMCQNRHLANVEKYFPSNQTLFHIYKPVADRDTKYFFEALHDPHLDRRYAAGGPPASAQMRHDNLRQLFIEWTSFTKTRDLKYWIAHGLLIGYYWSRDILPWDLDLDVQVTAHDLINRFSKHNNEMHQNRYLFEMNPHHIYRLHQFDNVIDARFIDIQTGLYLDVTGLSYNPKQDVFQCKSPHSYKVQDLFPLRQVKFCGVNTWVNNQIVPILAKEYGMKCMHETNHRVKVNGQSALYIFDNNKNIWVRSGK